MRIEEAKKKYLFKTKLFLHDDEEDYIVLREPTIAEMRTFQGKSDHDNFTLLEKLFPSCLVESSFTNDDDSPADSQTVYQFLRESGTLFTDLVNRWFASLPFQSPKRTVPK